MSRILLLTDSNFKNNIGAYKGRKLKDLEVKACQSRKGLMHELSNVEEGIVVMSCLDMVAADIVRTNASGAENAIEFYYNQILYKMVEKIDESDGKVIFGVVAPLFWSTHSEVVSRAMLHAFKVMKKTPVNKIWFSEILKGINAGSDGTHLTHQSANRYIEQIHNFAETIGLASGLGPVVFLAPDLLNSSLPRDWNEDMDVEAVTALAPPESDESAPMRSDTILSTSILAPCRDLTMLMPPTISDTQSRLIRLASPQLDTSRPPPTISSGGQNSNEQSSGLSLAGLGRRVSRLESNAFFTNLMTATLKEDQDTEANRAMLNRVTMAGVVIENLMTMSEEDKIRAMKATVKEIITNIKDEGQVIEVQFVRHLNQQIKGQKSAVIEVKLADAQQAKILRQEFVKKFNVFGKQMNITPVVRLATRVRIEIMHSVCFYLKRLDPTIVKATCLQFVPKPVIKVTRKTAAGNESSRTMTFIDAINWVRENNLADSIDLSKARERAGAGFRGTLAQHFVLLE